MGSACEAGELYQAIIRGKDWEELRRIASWYDYLEIQPCPTTASCRPDRNGKTIARDWEQIREWNRTVVRLGEELGKPVCATGDVHFLDPEDEAYRHVLLDTKGFDDADAPNPSTSAPPRRCWRSLPTWGRRRPTRWWSPTPSWWLPGATRSSPCPMACLPPSWKTPPRSCTTWCGARHTNSTGGSSADRQGSNRAGTAGHH